MKRPGVAFTLIELLVVIALIAIIAAILFPVFGTAKRRSLHAPCTANMRQLYLAFEMYSEDHGGVQSTPPSSLVDLGSTCVSDKRLFRCPAEHKIKPADDGSYQARIFFPLVKHPRSPWPISYGYVRDYPPADEAQEWERIRQVPNVGLFACIWHGKERGDFAGVPNLADMDGPVFRICFDGHLFVWPRKWVKGTLSIDDIFYEPWDRLPLSKQEF